MSKQAYEFNYDVRDASATQAEIEAAVAAYNLAEGIDIQVHQKRTVKSKKLIEGFFTFPANLAQEHLDWLAAKLESTFGLDGYVPVIPDPPGLALYGNLDSDAGIVTDFALPQSGAGIVAQMQIGVARETEPATASILGTLINLTGTPVYYDGIAAPAIWPFHKLVLYYSSPTEAAMTIPSSAALKMVGVGGDELPLVRTNDIVLSSDNNTGAIHQYWIDEAGKLYLAQTRNDAVLGFQQFEYDDAIVLGAV